VVRAGVLHRQPPGPRLGEYLYEQADALSEAVRDDDIVRIGSGSAYPVEIAGQGFAQGGRASTAEHRELLCWRKGKDPAQRSQPLYPGKVGNIGAAVGEVDPVARWRVRRRRLDQSVRPHQYLGVPAGAGRQVALGG